MSIKLICSDIDGTLLQYGKKTLEAEILSQIKALSARGILFCPASGRQYTSLRKLFEPVADCCVFLCENGGVLYKNEQCIGKTPMPRALAEEIAWDMWNRCDGQGEVMLSGQCCGYLMSRGLGMADRVKFIGNKYKFIHDPAEIPEDIVKVSVARGRGKVRLPLHPPLAAGQCRRGRAVLDRHHPGQQGHRRGAALQNAGHHPRRGHGLWRQLQRHRHAEPGGHALHHGQRRPRPARPLPAAHAPARGRAAYPFGIFLTQTAHMHSQRPIRIPCCTRMENPPILDRIFCAQIAKMYDNKYSVFG